MFIRCTHAVFMWSIFFFIVSIRYSNSFGMVVTIDADGSADYFSLDSALYELSNQLPDTILFIGKNSHKYTMSTYFDCNKSLSFVGSNQDPDHFPEIIHTDQNYFDFLKKNDIHFSCVCIQSSCIFEGSDSSTVSFDRCVIKNCTGETFFTFNSNMNKKIIFKNCLIINNNNSKSFIRLNFWENGPLLSIVNCTFESDSSIVEVYNGNMSKIMIKNCIFKSKKPIANNLRFLNKITNSITSDSLYGYGNYCISEKDPQFIAVDRVKPSDWKLKATTPAKDIGDTTDVILVDISGTPIENKATAGCWRIYDLPVITKEPQDIKTGEGKSAFFSVSVSGTGPFKYSWYKIGLPGIVLGDSCCYQIPVVSKNDSGSYYCLVSNNTGNVTSKTGNLIVIGKPQIRDSIADQNVFEGDTIVITIKSTGDDLHYQWFLNNHPIQNQNKPTLQLIAAINYDGGKIKCIVSNIVDTISTNEAILHVIANVKPKIISIKPLDTTITEGGSVTFRVEVLGSDTLFYKWYRGKDSVGIDKQYTINNVKVSDNNSSFFCIVSNKFGIDTSANAILKVKVKVKEKEKEKEKDISDSIIPNKIKIVSVTFDTVTNLIVLRWFIDTLGISNKSFQVMVQWGLKENDAKDYELIDNFNHEGINEKVFDLKGDIKFDTVYFFSMLLRDKSNMIWSACSDSAKYSIKIPPLKYQEVTYFKNSDTIIYSINYKVALKKDTNWDQSSIFIDTIDIIKLTDIPEGFIPVSIGVKFRSKNPFSIDIGIRYDSIPYGFCAQDIYMYENIDNAKYYLLKRCEIDTVKKMIFTNNNLSQHRNAFILMIDTFSPKVEILSDTSSIINAIGPLSVQISVYDNVENLNSELWAGNGARSLELIKKYNRQGNVTFEIPESLITTDNGLKSLLFISDGRNNVKYDISRSVFRNESDPLKSIERNWIPVIATSILDRPSLEDALDEFKIDNKWTYNSTLFRVFRWICYDGNNNDKDKWVEYSGSEEFKPFFNLIPGNVLWIKTRYPIVWNLGRGKTVSLKSNYKVKLKSKQWYDFSLPFRFDIRIDDILQATNITDSDRDLIWFYIWKLNEEKGQYHSEVFYVPPIPAQNDSEKKLSYKNVYTIYNALDRDIDLEIPPIPAATSNTYSYPKKISNVGWNIVIESKTGNQILPTVSCGYYSGEKDTTYIPEAPSFGNARISILDNNNHSWGHIIIHEKKDDLFIFPLVFNNKSNITQNIDYSFKQVNSLPKQMKTAIFDPLSKQLMINPLSLSVKVEAECKEKKWLLVGSEELIKQWTEEFKTYEFDLLTIIPDLYKKTFNVKFTVPYNVIKEIHLALFDQLGRRIWFKKMDKEILPGVNSIQCEKSRCLSPGFYFLMIKSYDYNGNEYGVRKGKFLYLF